MVYRELVEYIKQTREKGYSDDLISRALAAKGWVKHDVQAAYELVDQEKFRPLQGEAAKTSQEIVEEKQEQAEERKMVSKGFSSSAAWIRCISAPTTALSNARYFASYSGAAKSFVGAYLFIAAVLLALFYFGGEKLFEKLPANISTPLLALSVPFAVGLTLTGVISWLLQVTLLNFAAWLPAKFLLKGDASFPQQLYISSIAFGANFIMFAICLLLVAASAFFDTPAIPLFYLDDYSIPVITLTASVLAVAMLAYSFYLHVSAVRIAHGISSGKALFVILLGTAASFVIVSIILRVVFGAMVGTGLGSVGVENDALAGLLQSSGFDVTTNAGSTSPTPEVLVPI